MKRNTKNFFKVILLLSIFIHTTEQLHANDNSNEDKELSHEEAINSDELKKGELLFFGLIRTSDNTVNCASCHNTAVIDTFNWNPSALELAYSIQNMDSATYSNALLNPVTKRLSEVHENIQLTPEQVVLTRKYINTFKKTGLEEHKILIAELALFIFLIVLFIAAVIDLSVTKIIKYKALHGMVMLIAFVFILKIIVDAAIGLGRTEGYAPFQPIKFSHKVHVTDNKIDCIYCHHTVEDAKSAGIPSTNVCMNCHELVREGTHSGRFEIQKIISNMEKGQETQWIRIHKLPNHVFFSHAQHAGVGKLDCSECHGKVEEMHLLEQVEDLSMGWCLDCHRTQNVHFIDNKYYEKTFEEYHTKMKNNEIDSLTVAHLGGENCMKCHY